MMGSQWWDIDGEGSQPTGILGDEPTAVMG